MLRKIAFSLILVTTAFFCESAGFDINYTMDVEAVDLNGDGHKDLIEANYKYPYFMGDNTFGDDIIYHLNDGDGTFDTDSGTVYSWTDGDGGFDCIDVGRIFGDLFILVGMVALQGNDGGMKLIQVTGESPSFANVTDTFEISENGDFHCVKFVDANCDGLLDLAGLSSFGKMVIYFSTIETTDPGQSNVLSFHREEYNLLRDDIGAYKFSYNIPGTVWAWGDIDGDCDLDVYINVSDDPTIFTNLADENLSLSGLFTISDKYSIPNHKRAALSAGFGLMKNRGITKLALAIGSSEIGAKGMTGEGSGISTFFLNGDLSLGWRENSGAAAYYSYPFRMISDLKWISLQSNSNAQDLVTSAYGVIKNDSFNNYDINANSFDLTRDRGQMKRYTASSGGTNTTFDTISNIASNDNYTASSFLMSELSGAGTTVYYEWANYNFVKGDGDTLLNRDNLFYFRRFPVLSIDSVYVYSNSQWDTLNEDNYCYDLDDGWISIDSIIVESVTNVKVKARRISAINQYDIFLGICGVGASGNPTQYGGSNQVFLNVSNTSGTPATYNLDLQPPFDPETTIEHTYGSPNDPLPNYNYDSDGAIGIQVWSAESAEYFSYSAANLDPWYVMVDWLIEWPFQGHYMWGRTDKIFEIADSDNKRTEIYCTHTPQWCLGNFIADSSTALQDEQLRTCDERLQGYFLKNVIERYTGDSPIFDALSADSRPHSICIENEPNLNNDGYGGAYTLLSTHQSAILAIAMKLYSNYQSIKTANDDISVISPNFSAFEYNSDSTQAVYFDYLLIDPDSIPSGYFGVGTDITSLYSTVTANSNAKYQPLKKYTDWWDFQLSARDHPAIGDPVAGDPIFTDEDECDLLGNLGYVMGMFREHEINEVYGDNLSPNKRIVVLESTAFETGHAMSLNGLTFMKYPIGEEYADDFAKYFADFDTSGGENYKNVFYRRALLINPIMGVDSDILAIENTMAGIMKDKSAGPISLESCTYDTAGVNLHLNDTIDRPSLYLKTGEFSADSSAQGPTVMYFSYISDSSSNGMRLTQMVRTVEGVSRADVDIPLLFRESQLINLPVQAYLYDSEGFFTQREKEPTIYSNILPVFFQTDDWRYVYDMTLNQSEISTNSLILDPSETGLQDYSQGIYFRYQGNGWNLVSFNIWPEDPISPGSHEFFADSVFDPDDWMRDGSSLIGQIENWEGNYFIINEVADTSYLWNMEQGYRVQLTGDTLFVLSNDDYFTPDSIFLPDSSQDEFFHQITDTTYRFFIGYYPNYLMPCSTGFEDMIDNYGINVPNGHLLGIKDDDENMWYYRNNETIWKGNLGMLEPGRGYELVFDDSVNTYRKGFTYPETPGSESVPGGGKNTGPGSLINSLYEPHFSYISHTQFWYPVVIDSIYIEGVDISVGDEVGIFTPAGLCVGAKTFTGEYPLYLAAWKDDPTTEIIDGYTDGESMTFEYWDASQGIEFEFQPLSTINALAPDDKLYPNHSGFGKGFGAFRTLSSGNPTVNLPQVFSLEQNYPNPFNPSTTIPFALPTESKVKIEIYNILGQKVDVLRDCIYQAGYYKIVWNGSQAASGIYIIRMEANGTVVNKHFCEVNKMILLK